MSEHLPSSPEHHVHHEHAPKPEHKERHEHKTTSQEAKHDHNIDKLKKSIHQEAISSHEVTIGEHRHNSHQPILGLQRELKASAYKRTLHKVQAHLGSNEQTFSKFIHQPKVEAVSEISSKTIARPSGILGGGLVAFIGSGFVLYLSKHNGFRYNFFIFILLFLTGFVAGALCELLVRSFWRKQT